jgi:ABC-type nitrate/sulfonate/bicarbonate transport system ATPase subunit
VAIARVIANTPGILLMDEPFVALARLREHRLRRVPACGRESNWLR